MYRMIFIPALYIPTSKEYKTSRSVYIPLKNKEPFSKDIVKKQLKRDGFLPAGKRTPFNALSHIGSLNLSSLNLDSIGTAFTHKRYDSNALSNQKSIFTLMKERKDDENSM